MAHRGRRTCGRRRGGAVPEAIVPEPAFEIFRVRHRGRRRPRRAGDAEARLLVSARRGARGDHAATRASCSSRTRTTRPACRCRSRRFGTIARARAAGRGRVRRRGVRRVRRRDVHPRARRRSRTSSSAGRSRRRSASPACASAASSARRTTLEPIRARGARLQREHRGGRRGAGGARRIAATCESYLRAGRGVEGAALRGVRAARPDVLEERRELRARRGRRAARSDSSTAPPTRGIYLRDRSTEPGCAGCLRIATGVVEHTQPLHRRDGGGPVRRARNRSADDRNADRADARPRGQGPVPASAPASGSSITCSSSFARHGGFDLRDRGRRAISTSISITPSRTSASRSARRCRRRSATGAASTAPAISSCRWTRRSPSRPSISAAGRTPSSISRCASRASAICRPSSCTISSTASRSARARTCTSRCCTADRAITRSKRCSRRSPARCASRARRTSGCAKMLPSTKGLL